MKSTNIQLNLRAIRVKAGLSLSKTAEKTGVSKAMLGQIERGESSPTIATLWKLAKGFHLPLTAFIEDLAHTQETYSLAQSHPVKFEGSIGFHTVFPFDPVLGSETFLMTLDPGQVHTSNPHDIGVIEDVFVTLGVVGVLKDGEWNDYNCGDGLRFRGDQPHGYRNTTSQIVQFHNTIHYPKTNMFS